MRTDRSEIHAEFPDQDAPLAWVAQVFTGLLVVAAGARSVHLLISKDHTQWAWLDVVLVMLAVAATVAGQARRLPLQNVGTASVIMLGIGGLAMAVGARTGVPFGAVAYTESAGVRILGTVPWLLPLLWVVVLFNARSVGRLVFRPWRKSRTYGLRVIALTCVMAVGFSLALEPYASKLNRYWLWRTDQGTLAWYGAPWVNFLGWLLVSILIMAFATPFLLNKKPKKSPPFYQPLVIWVTLQVVFAAGAASGGMKSALYFILFTVVATLSGALAGGRW